MSSTSCDEYRSFRYWRRQDCNDIVECTRWIAKNDQLCTVSVPRVSQYIAREMGIRGASKFLCTPEENLLTIGFIFVLNKLNFYSHSLFWLRSTHTVQCGCDLLTYLSLGAIYSIAQFGCNLLTQLSLGAIYSHSVVWVQSTHIPQFGCFLVKQLSTGATYSHSSVFARSTPID